MTGQQLTDHVVYLRFGGRSLRAPQRGPARRSSRLLGVRVRTPRHPKTGETEQILDVLDWIHAVTLPIPDPGQNTTLHFGAYAGRRRIAPRPPKIADSRRDDQAPDDEPTPKGSWARLIRRLFEFDPLLCRCGTRLELIACITKPETIDRILRHIRSDRYRPKSPYTDSQPRPPPPSNH